MAKYLEVGTSGFPTEKAAINTSAGAGDANKIVETNGSGKIDITLLPSGLGADSKATTAGESLSAGDLVYLNASGAALKADANDVAKSAIGFVLASAATSAAVTVYFEGTITGLSALTPGAKHFLSATAAGSVSTSIPSGAGDIVQYIGTALSATEITFEAGEPIVRA